MFKRYIIMKGPSDTRYIRRTKDIISITDNIAQATDYFTVCEDHEELMASDFAFVASRLPEDVVLEIKDIKVTMTIENVDLADTLVQTKMRSQAIAKLTPSEIEILGLQSDAMFAKLKYGGTKPPTKIDDYRTRPQFRPTTATFKKQLGSVVAKGKSYDYDDEEDDWL